MTPPQSNIIGAAERGSTRIYHVKFVHHAAFLVPRGSKPYDVWLSASTPAVIRSPRPDEAATAFRIRYQPSHGRVREETEIVAHDGHLWWPLWTSSIRPDATLSGPPDETIAADDLGLLLRSRRPPFATRSEIRNYADSWFVRERKTVGRWLSSDEEQKAAHTQRKVFENLMIWNGRAYARGGRPIYAQRPLGQGFYDTGVANTGYDRSVDPTEEMPWDIGRNRWAQEAIATGFFQPADQYKVAKKIHSKHRCDGGGGRIEVMLPAHVEIAREELQLDALFRVVLRLLKEGIIKSEPLLNAFNEVAVKDHRLPSTSGDRFAVLRLVIAYCVEDERHARMRYLSRWIYEALLRFLPPSAPMFERNTLCEFDEKALDSFRA